MPPHYPADRSSDSPLFPILIAFALIILAGCHKASSPPPAEELRRYPAVGIVKTLEPDGKTVVIQHEAITNYMPAMTMPFEVKDRKELNGLHEGDWIAFHLVVTSHDGWIENIDILSNATPVSAPGPAPRPAPELSFTHAVPPLDVGDKLPDYHFTNELGQPVTLGTNQGQVFAFTFFFTRCPFPTACPLLSDNFSSTSEKLPALSGAPAQWHLYSISFDPQNDTTNVLLDYAHRYHYDPAHWSFLAGDLETVNEMADQFGEEFQNNGQTISHNFRTVIVGPDGRIRRIFPGNAWTADDLAREMLKASQYR